MKKVLIIAYIFPPTASTGVHRVTEFCRNLPSLGWQPTVITTGNSVYRNRDPQSEAGLGRQTRIHRVTAIEAPHVVAAVQHLLRLARLEDRLGDAVKWRMNRLLTNWRFPDPHVRWAHKATSAAKRLARDGSFDAVFTTSWPYSDHLIGNALSTETGMPWIADFRDPWIGNPEAVGDESADPAMRMKEKAMEKMLVSRATFVVSTAEATRKMFRDRYPELPAGHFRLVRNGYEPSYLAANTSSPGGPLKIGFVGAFYRRRSSPAVFAQAIDALRREGTSPTELQLTFTGDMGGTEQEFIGRGLTEFCHFTGVLPAQRCYHRVSDCQVLWLYQHPEEISVVAGKTYEYLAAKRWILASVPVGSEVARIIEGAGDCAEIVDPDDLTGTVQALRGLLTRHRAGELKPSFVDGYVEQFSRQAQAERLAEILAEAAG